MNTKQEKFLKSGVVEDYFLGTASPEDVEMLMALCKRFPEAQAYLEASQKSIKAVICPCSKKPSERSRNIIRNSILDNLKLKQAKLNGTKQMLSEFIGLSRHSKVEYWDKLLEEVKPPPAFDNIYAKTIYASEKEELMVVWAKGLIPEEVHSDTDERFLLLEGTIDCYMEDEKFSMERGDFMRIPINVRHRVVVTSQKPGKAIRSWVMIKGYD